MELQPRGSNTCLSRSREGLAAVPRYIASRLGLRCGYYRGDDLGRERTTNKLGVRAQLLVLLRRRLIFRLRSCGALPNFLTAALNICREESSCL